MEKSIDATEVDFGPIPENREYMALYYVAFVVVYSFFFLNIFVALIIVTFQEQGEKEITGSELDKNQVIIHFVVLYLRPLVFYLHVSTVFIEGPVRLFKGDFS